MNRRWGKCGTQKAESAGNIFKDTLWKKEKELCEQWQHGRSTIDLDETDKSASVITAHWTSVRDTVRKIETLALTTVLAVSCGDLAGAGEDDRAPMEGKPKPSVSHRGSDQQYAEKEERTAATPAVPGDAAVQSKFTSLHSSQIDQRHVEQHHYAYSVPGKHRVQHQSTQAGQTV